MAIERDRDQRKRDELLSSEQLEDSPDEIDCLSVPDGPLSDPRALRAGDDLTLMLDLGSIQEETRPLSEVTTSKYPLTRAAVQQGKAGRGLQAASQPSIRAAAEKAGGPPALPEERRAPPSVGVRRVDVYAVYAIWVMAFALLLGCLLTAGNLLTRPGAQPGTQMISGGQVAPSSLPAHSASSSFDPASRGPLP